MADARLATGHLPPDHFFKEPDMTRIVLAGTTALALLAGCAHSAPSAAAPQPDHAGAMMAMCPMGVPGTTVAAADVANGSAVTFTTTDQVAELQRRVHAMVAMHNKHHDRKYCAQQSRPLLLRTQRASPAT